MYEISRVVFKLLESFWYRYSKVEVVYRGWKWLGVFFGYCRNRKMVIDRMFMRLFLDYEVISVDIIVLFCIFSRDISE